VSSLIYPALCLVFLASAIRAWSASARARGRRALAWFAFGVGLGALGVHGALLLRQMLGSLPQPAAGGIVGMGIGVLCYVLLKEWRALGAQPTATSESPSTTSSADPSSGKSTATPTG
jgi:hypothetical protein